MDKKKEKKVFEAVAECFNTINDKETVEGSDLKATIVIARTEEETMNTVFGDAKDLHLSLLQLAMHDDEIKGIFVGVATEIALRDERTIVN